jgi:PhnB protein
MSTTKDNRIIQPYLFFNGCCEQAVEFYRKALGAEVEAMVRFKDSPEQPPPGMIPPGFENKIMHTSFRIGQTTVMASDGCSVDKAHFEGFSLSLSVPSEAEAERAFAALADGGQVQMPLTKTFFSSRFGMVTDRFGVSWMIQAARQGQK